MQAIRVVRSRVLPLSSELFELREHTEIHPIGMLEEHVLAARRDPIHGPPRPLDQP